MTDSSSCFLFSIPSSPDHSVTIHRHGATILSWIAYGKERLYQSPLAKMDGSKAIRGGIPLAFPVFGKVDWLTGQHGFARDLDWQLSSSPTQGSVPDDQACFQMTLESEAMSAYKNAFPYQCRLLLRVTLSKGSLGMVWEIQNLEPIKSLPFQFLFHSYFLASAVENVEIRGLESMPYRDHLKSNQVSQASKEKLTIQAEVDRSYTNAPSTLRLVDKARPFESISITKSTTLPDYVIWNPWIVKSKTMTDFPDDDYKRMVCIEAGAIQHNCILEAGQCWSAHQTLQIETDQAASTLMPSFP